MWTLLHSNSINIVSKQPKVPKFNIVVSKKQYGVVSQSDGPSSAIYPCQKNLEAFVVVDANGKYFFEVRYIQYDVFLSIMMRLSLMIIYLPSRGGIHSVILGTWIR